MFYSNIQAWAQYPGASELKLTLEVHEPILPQLAYWVLQE
jgi:hypothetical protein